MSRCVVLGGGVVGASVAYHLAAEGEQVVLVDRADPGQATAAGAGIVSPALFPALDPALHPLAFRAVDYYPHLLEALRDRGQPETDYEQVGALHLAVNADERAKLADVRRLFEERRAAGAGNIGELSTLTGTEIRSLCPVLDESHEAIHTDAAARVDGRSLRDALLGAFAACGGDRMVGDGELVLSGTRVSGVTVGGDRLAADAVVLATGSWSDAIAGAGGATFGLSPQRGQIVHLSMPAADTARWPIVVGFEPYYLLAFPGERVVVGATRESGTGFDYRVTAAGQLELLSHGLALAPGLAGATLIETRVGFRPVTPDGLPLIGRLPDYEGVIVATGLGPQGLSLGPYVGALVAGLILERQPSLDLSPYALDRSGLRRAGATPS